MGQFVSLFFKLIPVLPINSYSFSLRLGCQGFIPVHFIFFHKLSFQYFHLSWLNLLILIKVSRRMVYDIKWWQFICCSIPSLFDNISEVCLCFFDGLALPNKLKSILHNQVAISRGAWAATIFATWRLPVLIYFVHHLFLGFRHLQNLLFVWVLLNFFRAKELVSSSSFNLFWRVLHRCLMDFCALGKNNSSWPFFCNS